MKKPTILAVLALLGVSFAACDQIALSPSVCSIVGQVSIEGTGIDGVTVTLSNGNSTTTTGGGKFRFDNVEGAVTLTISGFPSDATFDATSVAVINSCDGTVTINFSGSYTLTA